MSFSFTKARLIDVSLGDGPDPVTDVPPAPGRERLFRDVADDAVGWLMAKQCEQSMRRTKAVMQPPGSERQQSTLLLELRLEELHLVGEDAAIAQGEKFGPVRHIGNGQQR